MLLMAAFASLIMGWPANSRMAHRCCYDDCTFTDQRGVNRYSAYFFAFYFGMVSNITLS